jgi:hypothetical protein
MRMWMKFRSLGGGVMPVDSVLNLLFLKERNIFSIAYFERWHLKGFLVSGLYAIII